MREILNTLGRFLGIFAIVALGVSFYAGLGATGPDMKLTGDTYFQAQNLMDIRVVGTYGLTDADVTAMRQMEGVRQVFPSYSADAQFETADDAIVLKLHGLDTAAMVYDKDGLLVPLDWVNKPLLMSGRYPERAGEILVEGGFLWRTGLAVGDTITLESGKNRDLLDTLTTKAFTITGTARTPVYMAHERGNGSIGSGAVDAFAYIACETFRAEVYSEAFVTLADTEGVSSFTAAYEEALDAALERLEALGEVQSEARLRELTEDAYAAIHEARAELEEQERSAAEQFAEAEEELAAARQTLESGRAEAAQGRRSLAAQSAELTSAETQLREGIRAAEEDLAALEAQMQAPVLMPESVIDTAANAPIDAGMDMYAALERQMDSLRQELAAVEAGKTQLLTAQAQIDAGEREADAAEELLAEQSAELETKRAETAAQIADAREELDAQQKKLDELAAPVWYVLDRGVNPGYTSFAEDTDKVQAIGRVFPLIFFIVAALVSLTTMTRLVEERRTEIGTLKSLGYGNLRIASKYLIYAIAPTLLGGIFGGIVGMKLFPWLIIDAYGMLYTLPAPITPIHYGYWAVSMGMAVACTVLAALFACLNELRAVPSQLMRPKAPKTGKRIFLERIPAVWRMLSFTYKVTVRNLTRYKKRFLMTVIGISGCTALLVTGFGLRDSVSDIIGLQYSAINQYNLMVAFRDGAESSDVTNAMERLAAHESITGMMRVRQKSVDAGAGLSETRAAYLVVPESAAALSQFVTLRDRRTHEPYVMEENGVVITEKLAKETGLSVGDAIVLSMDGRVVSVPVTAITEHYFLHYIYMPPSLYAEVFGEAAVHNMVFARTADESKAAQTEIAALVLSESGVSAIHFSKVTQDTFTNIISNLNFVIVVLIVSAGALAFVVLLNLTNINISERIRELATIAVLGFTDREISAYVFRENAILTVFGTGAGLVLGVFLHGYVIQTVETDMFMFGMQVQPMSFVYSLLLTFLFSLTVNVLTGGRLKRIDMVEALKSVE